MSPKQFLKQFGSMADAPNGIAKLRELILQLAVQGKLVPQDPSDEPANVLLEKIKAEKAKLVKEGKIKKSKPLPVIEADGVPFKLPSGWGWCRLGEVTNYGATDKAEPNNVTNETWVLELEDVEKISSRLLKIIFFKDRQFKSSKNKFKKGDVIYGKLRPYLDKVIVADRGGVCTTEMIPIRGYNGIIPKYLRLHLKSPYFIEYANNSTHGMNLPRMGTEKGRAALFSLPPLKEQTRIVAKVDQLMALCDKLEAKQTTRTETHSQLIRATHHQLTEAHQTDQLATAWQRIHNNFDQLHTTVESVKQLRQTILQLAVQGKLVPQASSDEPASVLLEKINAEKERLIKEGKIKKSKPLPAIEPDKVPYELPKGWEWVRTEDVCETIIDCPHSTPIFVANGIVSLDTNSFKKGAIIPHKLRFVSKETYNERIRRLTPLPGDIVFAREGSVGESVIIPKDMTCCLGQRVMLFRLFKVITNAYFQLALSGPSSLGRLLSLHKGIGAKHVNVRDMRNVLIPLPPCREQPRIVAKVDELMALCDELEAKLIAKETTAKRFAEAVTHCFAAA